MKKLRLFIILFLLLPAALLAWLTMTQSGLQWAYQQAEFYLPLQLQVNRIEGRLFGPLTAYNADYQQDGVTISADKITLDWEPAALLAANISISQLHVQGLYIVLSESEETAQSAAPLQKQTSLPDISLPWRLVIADGQVDDFSLSRQQQTFSLNTIKLNASSLFQQVNIKQLSASADNYSVEIKGDLQPAGNYKHKLEIQWQAILPSSAEIKGLGELKGDLQNTRLKHTLSGPLKLKLDAQASKLLEQMNWNANVEAEQFDLSRLDKSWPALSGKLKLDASGDLNTATLDGELNGLTAETGEMNAAFKIERLHNIIQIKQLDIHAPKTDTRIASSGSWLPAKNGGDIKLSLNWSNLRWPMQQPPWFNSKTGSGSIDGNIDHYAINMTSDSPWPDHLASKWQASATGNLQGLEIQSLRVTALEGEALASGQLSWSPELNWQANISALGINPASLLPQWPGKLNARATSSGSMHNGKLLINADIKQIDGQLRNYPVSLHSRLKWYQNSLNISQLNFNSGKSMIKLDGQLGDKLKLGWSISSANLAELYPHAKGKLQANGKLSGAQKAPLMEASISASELSYLKHEIAALDGHAAVDLQHWQTIDIQLAAKSLKLGHYKLQTLEINADNQQLQAKAVSQQATAMLTLKGRPNEDGWHGYIEQADVSSEYYDHWQLQKPAELNISTGSLLTKNLCWQSSKQAELCASVDYAKTSLHSHIELQNLPLKLFSHWLPDEVKLEGKANGKADIDYLATEKLLAEIDIKLPAGAINYPTLNDEHDRREYRSGHLYLKINPQGLKASSSLIMANNDNATASLEMPGFMPLASDPGQTLKAEARLNVSDLKLIEHVVPEIYNPQGELRLKLDASGTIEQPSVRGHATMVNASVQIPRLGLSIKEISLNALSEGYEKFTFQVQARSGDGSLAVNGHTHLDRRAGWATEINVKGSDFEAAQIPEARLQVSPELQVSIKNRDINIKGNVHIPYAKLQPRDVARAASVSRDAVIIGSEQVPEEKWLITTAVRLTLGERVHFYGFGFEGRLGGSLLLEDTPGQLTRATGEINIPEGNYRAYGQRLEIEHGRAIFAGSPLTNPGLDVRAVRKVSDVTAGLNVTGTLRQPKLEIFSSPAMGQTDALAYLLLGRPLESADSEDGNMMAKAALALGLSGGDVIARSLGDRFGLDEMRIESSGQGDQAALVVGRYLSPRLYASYGVGLIESVNTLTLRYTISKKWEIKAESGGYQGADILYMIER